MKRIKVKFIDYYGREPKDLLIYQILTKFYEVELSDEPDYVIDGGLGREYVNYDCVKLIVIGESYVPDFNEFDYAIGFDHLQFGDRYLRFPLYAMYEPYKYLVEKSAETIDSRALLNREFCSFVVSNDEGDPMRIEFFKRLSKYKQVASGGKLFNNVGGRVPDKMAFIAKYKFNIAFENSCVPGYTTEKVMEPMAARSLPIYYGNPLIAEDFNPAAMVHVASRDDMERAIEEIIALDKDDDAYLKRLSAPAIVHPYTWHEARLTEFLRYIFDQPLEKAKRLNDYGYQINIRRRLHRLWNMYEWTSPARIMKRIKKGIGK